MKSFPKITILFLPWFYFVLVLQSVFFDFELVTPDIPLDENSIAASYEPVLVQKPGILQRIGAIQTILPELENQSLPSDTDPEESVERLRRILIGQILLLAFQIFLLLLTFSSFFSYFFRAWFSLPLQRILFLGGFPFGLQQGFLYIKLGVDGAFFGFALGLFFILGSILGLFAFFWIKKSEPDLTRFLLLKHSASLDEEGRSIQNQEKNSYLQFGFHFALILIFGILFGNLVYIPLFSLQKHYSQEFGILLGCLLVLLSGFYVFNYSRHAGGLELKKIPVLLISFAYLQFRFLKNAFTILFVTLVLGVSVLVLFRILTWNTEFLQKEAGILEESTKL